MEITLSTFNAVTLVLFVAAGICIAYKIGFWEGEVQGARRQQRACKGCTFEEV